MSATRILKEQSGMATVEMSFIIPIVLSMILSIFYIIFYQIDRSIAESVLSEEIIGVSDVVKSNGKSENGRYTLSDFENRELFYMLKTNYLDLQREATNHIQENLGRRLLLSKMSQTSIYVKNKETEGEVRVQMDIPISLIGQVIGEKLNWKYKICIPNIEGAEEIRRWSAIE
ncbi:MAG: TadE family protein [Lachnospiraceae bacterium]